MNHHTLVVVDDAGTCVFGDSDLKSVVLQSAPSHSCVVQHCIIAGRVWTICRPSQQISPLLALNCLVGQGGSKQNGGCLYTRSGRLNEFLFPQGRLLILHQC